MLHEVEEGTINFSSFRLFACVRNNNGLLTEFYWWTQKVFEKFGIVTKYSYFCNQNQLQ